MNRWYGLTATVIAASLLTWFAAEQSFLSLLVLGLFIIVLLIALIIYLFVRYFNSRKPQRKSAHRAAGAIIASLISAILVLSVLSIVMPLTSTKAEPKIGSDELWVGIDSTDIRDFSLKAPYNNVTLAKVGECNADNLVMKKGGSSIISRGAYFEDVILETTYLDSTVNLFEIELPLSLYGASKVPELLSSLLNEVSLEDVIFHSPDFSASKASFDSMSIESNDVVLIRAERIRIPDLRSLLSDLISRREIIIDEMMLENGSFILEGISISFDSASIEDVRLELNWDLISTALSTIPRKQYLPMIGEALPALPGALIGGKAIELSNVALGIKGTIDAGASELVNLSL